MPTATVAESAELNFLRPWREPVTPRRFLRAAGASAIFHAALLAGLLALPDVPFREAAPEIVPNLNNSVHLVPPRFYEPTQKDPNRGKVTRGLDLHSGEAGQPAQARRFHPPVPIPGPPAPAPQQEAGAKLAQIDAPKIEIAAGEAPRGLGTAPLPALPGPPQGTPRLQLENVPGGNSSAATTPADPKLAAKLRGPATSLEALARAAVSQPAGGVTIGDAGEDLPGLPGIDQAPSSCQACSTLQLKTDPMNVDFRPYLRLVMTRVKQSWLAVIPESAKMGRRDQVVVEFSIDRGGTIPKLVILSGARVEALNRAAVAGLSASVPFPPLPAAYKGDRIVLDMTFLYNIARR